VRAGMRHVIPCLTIDIESSDRLSAFTFHFLLFFVFLRDLRVFVVRFKS